MERFLPYLNCLKVADFKGVFVNRTDGRYAGYGKKKIVDVVNANHRALISFCNPEQMVQNRTLWEA